MAERACCQICTAPVALAIASGSPQAEEPSSLDSKRKIPGDRSKRKFRTEKSQVNCPTRKVPFESSQAEYPEGEIPNGISKPQFPGDRFKVNDFDRKFPNEGSEAVWLSGWLAGWLAAGCWLADWLTG